MKLTSHRRIVASCLSVLAVVLGFGQAVLAGPSLTNSPIFTNTAFAAGDAWLEKASGAQATVSWIAPAGMTTTGILVRVWETTAAQSNLLGEGHLAASAHQVVINGLVHQHPYRCIASGLGATGAIWTCSMAWEQPVPVVTCSQLFPAMPLQSAPDGERMLWRSQDIAVSNNVGWTYFFVAGSSATYAAWKTRGLSLFLECEGHETKLCGASHDCGDMHMMVPASEIPAGDHTIRFLLRYDGKGRLGLSCPLYCLVWVPTFTFAVVEEE